MAKMFYCTKLHTSPEPCPAVSCSTRPSVSQQTLQSLVTSWHWQASTTAMQSWSCSLWWHRNHAFFHLVILIFPSNMSISIHLLYHCKYSSYFLSLPSLCLALFQHANPAGQFRQ